MTMIRKTKTAAAIRWMNENEIKIELNLSLTFLVMEVTCLTTIREKTK